MKYLQKTSIRLLTGTVLVSSLFFISACGPADEAAAPDAAQPSGEATGVAEVAAPAGGGMMALVTEIPPEVLEGTPMPINVPNLEPAASSAPTMQVPEGTVLVSLGKPVTSSDDFPIIGQLEMITDGEKDGGEGFYVELMDGLQWVQIDLEETTNIQAVWVWHFHSQMRAYHDVVVQVSNDPDFQEGVTTLFNNDTDNSSGLGRGSDRPYVENRFGKLINGKGVPARYIRLYSDGNTSSPMNHYIEVEVWGTPAGS